MSTSSPTNSSATAGAKNLQENLHQLLTRLSSTIDIIKTWPESDGDDASYHVETTTKLITAIVEVLEGIKDVEGVVKADNALRKSLKDCQIPINLLDLLDHGTSGLNPDCFMFGLLREALGQLKGLRRRKLALKMLGEAVQSGLNKKDSASSSSTSSLNEKNQQGESSTNKRKREVDDNDENDEKGQDESSSTIKKARTD